MAPLCSGALRLLLLLQIYLIHSVICAPAPSAIPIPGPTGPFAVGTVSLETIDYSRQDPYAPTPQPRALMVSFFYPTTDTRRPFAPYLPTNLAAYGDQALGFPAGFLETLRTWAFQDARLMEIPDVPIILFSPGLGGLREKYTIMLEGLASYGYMVVALDHTYDAGVVEFPDGDLVIGLTSINGDAKSLNVRSKDVSFVVDQLQNASFVSQIPGVVHRNFRNCRVAMFGHSLGGATALQVMEQDRRVLGGCSLDGPLLGAEVTTGTGRPFLLMGADGHTRFNDPAWAETWNHLTGWRAELTLANSTHLTFMDDSAIYASLGLLALEDPDHSIYGTINGIRANAVLIAYLKAFFDFVLFGKPTSIFKHADPKFPEITIV